MYSILEALSPSFGPRFEAHVIEALRHGWSSARASARDAA